MSDQLDFLRVPAADKFTDLKFVGTSAPARIGNRDRRDDPRAKEIADRPTDQIAGLEIFTVTGYGESDAGSDVPPVYVLQGLFKSHTEAARDESFNGIPRVFGAKSLKEVSGIEGTNGLMYKCGKFVSGYETEFCSYVLGNLLVFVVGEPNFNSVELLALVEELAKGHMGDVEEE